MITTVGPFPQALPALRGWQRCRTVSTPSSMGPSASTRPLERSGTDSRRRDAGCRRRASCARPRKLSSGLREPRLRTSPSATKPISSFSTCTAGRAGRANTMWTDFDAAWAKMEESCTELFGEGKDEAALEIVARREQLEAQRLSLLTELLWAGGAHEFDASHYEKDREAGVPLGTTFRLEMTLAATAATSPPRRSKDGSAEVRQLAELVARLTRATAAEAGACRSAGAPGERAAIAKAFGELEAWLEGTPMTYTLMEAVDSENGVISLVYTLKASEDPAIAHRARVVLLRWERLRAELLLKFEQEWVSMTSS